VIAGDEMTVDFSEMSEQVKGCINSGFYGGGRTCVRVAFKYLIATDEPANEGTFRPVKMILPQGKAHQRRTDGGNGPLQYSLSDGHRLHHQSLGAGLTRARDGRAFRDVLVAELGGKRTDTGAVFKANDSGHGGWGACAIHDGAGPFRTMAHGDTR
jgi:N-methylhydantoinase B